MCKRRIEWSLIQIDSDLYIMLQYSTCLATICDIQSFAPKMGKLSSQNDIYLSFFHCIKSKIFARKYQNESSTPKRKMREREREKNRV